MSRWLDLATQSELNSNSLTDTQQEPAKRGATSGTGGFLMVSAGCRVEKTKTGDGSAVPCQSNIISLDDWRARPSFDREKLDRGTS